MQKKQINKLRMFSAVDLVLTNNQSLFATVDDLTNGHERLRVGLELIGQRRLVQETDNTGMTGHKIDLRSGVIVGSLLLCAALKAYANATNDKVLLAKVDYVKSDFTQVADSVVFDIATLLLFLASPLLPLLEKYFVDVQIISEFNAELNRFHDSLPQKRVATAGTKVATENIGQVFDTLTNLLNDEIDVLIDLFKEREPRFFMEYTNARIIVNYGEGASLKTPLPVVPIAEPK